VDNRIRITAQLVDAHTDAHVWAEKFDGGVEDLFAIQERIARVVVSALQLHLSADEDRRLGERGIENIHAYECYLRARQQGWRWRKDAIDQAIQLLRNGLAIVGDNARLYAALGVAHLQYRDAGIDFGEGPIVEAEACASRVRARARIRRQDCSCEDGFTTSRASGRRSRPASALDLSRTTPTRCR
jgi:non-specific serine/threonine protein kinase